MKPADIIDGLRERGLYAKVKWYANGYGVSVVELIGGRRRIHVKARREAWRALHRSGWSHGEIARMFQRDRSTIGDACRVAA